MYKIYIVNKSFGLELTRGSLFWDKITMFLSLVPDYSNVFTQISDEDIASLACTFLFHEKGSKFLDQTQSQKT